MAIQDGKRSTRAKGESENAVGLGEAGERLALAGELAGIGVWELDLVRDRLSWDGYEPTGRLAPFDGDWRQLVHEDDLAQVTAELDRAVDATTALHTEFRLVHPDGEVRHVKATGRVLLDDAGRPARVAGIRFDITEIKRTEEALREREQRLLSIFRVAPTGFGVVSNRVLLEVNDRLCQMVGRSQEELLGQNARILYPTQEHFDDVGKRKYEQIREHGTGFVETRWQHRDGSELDVLLGSTPIDPQDLTKGVTFIALDITERKQAERQRAKLEEQLRQALKMEAIGRLAGGIAHDFNNLLTGIVGTAELLLAGELQPDASLREDLEAIRHAGSRAAALTGQLLAFSRKQAISPVVLQPNEILDNAQRMLRRLVGEDIEIVYRPAADLGCVKADPSQLDQILVNLAVNARDAMPRGGTLTIVTRNVDRDDLGRAAELAPPAAGIPIRACIEISVSDTGAGMEQAIQRRIFEPFFSTKVEGRGTGLGLATVYGIVRQNGGWISVVSSPGEGSTFTVALPRVDASPLDDVPARAAAAPRGDETVLLVEDEAVVRHLARRLLTDLGYRVLEACDGTEAIRIHAQHAGRVDLLLTDVVMPRIGGRELYRTLAARDPELRVLYISGYTEEQLAEDGPREEGIRLLRKPFGRQELAIALREALGR